ncbi:MAG: twin-arginine translocase subunit TatC [Pyrinomonadaceae bacterium]
MFDSDENEEELGGNMSFLEHLDEFRKRLIRSIFAVTVTFIFCYAYSESIYNFLAVPVTRALTEAQRVQAPIEGITGNENVIRIEALKNGDSGRYVFNAATQLGSITIPPGTAVLASVQTDKTGKKGIFTEEPIFIGNQVLSKGLRLPTDFLEVANNETNTDEKMVFTTALEPFTLYLTVSIYAAIALAIPFILYQIWGFISPALYQHERKYVTPFILLSSISFVCGAAFAYYILFPPAVRYLIGVGKDFTPFLKATDYFDFIIIIMLAMGVIFQMPAVAYVLSRIGIVNARLLIKGWKIAVVIILIVAAVVSPTADIPNMMLFAAPMLALYVVSIFVAWIFGKKRVVEPE